VSLQAVNGKLSTAATTNMAQVFLRIIRHPSFHEISNRTEATDSGLGGKKPLATWPA
jgi:hypothetical protein